MITHHPFRKLFLVIIMTIIFLSACSPSVQSADPGVDPPQDPEVNIEPLGSPTPYPKGQAQFSISRSGEVTLGDGGTIEVHGEFPIDIYFTQGEEVAPEIFYSEGYGTGVLTMGGHGTIGTGEITGIYEVKFEVIGVFKPAPDCSLELTIAEKWLPDIELTMTVNGKIIIQTSGTGDIILFSKSEHEFNNILFAMGIGEEVEVYLEPGMNWVNTYKISSLQVPEFIGCDVVEETVE